MNEQHEKSWARFADFGPREKWVIIDAEPGPPHRRELVRHPVADADEGRAVATLYNSGASLEIAAHVVADLRAKWRTL